jgi:preprotein translocase subunit SecD
MRMASGERSVYVSRSNVVTDDVVLKMRATQVEDGLVLEVTLSAEGTQRLAAVTRSQAGQQLAVLVNSQLVSSALILPPFGPAIATESSRRIVIGAQLPPEKAAQVQAKIAERWPD